MRDRGTMVVSVALCGALAVGSYWMAQQARLSDVAPHAMGHDVDYTARDITLTRMDLTGRPTYVIDATKLVHFVDDDTGELTLPRVVGSKPGRPEMTFGPGLRERHVDGEEVRLYGNAVLTRKPWRGAAALVAKSDYLLAYPDTEKLETDRPIEIVRGGSRVNANGMKYDNATQRVEFDGGPGGRIREVLAPRGALTAPPDAPTAAVAAPPRK